MPGRQVRLVLVALVLIAVAVGATLAVNLGTEGDPDSSPGSTRSAAPEPTSLVETDGLFHGAYAGRVAGTGTLVAVEAAPPDADGAPRRVTVFVSDGTRLAVLFEGDARERLATASLDDDAEVEATILADRVTGRVRIDGRRPLRFDVPRAAGAAGLYTLDVDRRGALSGATLAGVGASGRTALEPPGTGHLDLADGRRLTFAVARARGLGLRADAAHLIVLANGRIAGLAPADGGPVGVRSSRG